VLVYCDAGPQCDPGEDGTDAPTVEEVRDMVDQAITDHCAAQPGGTCEGSTGDTGPRGTALPGAYDCPDGEYVTGFTVADDGAVTLACEDATPPIIPTPEEGT